MCQTLEVGCQRFADANFTAGVREREDANRTWAAGDSVSVETERRISVTRHPSLPSGRVYAVTRHFPSPRSGRAALRAGIIRFSGAAFQSDFGSADLNIFSGPRRRRLRPERPSRV